MNEGQAYGAASQHLLNSIMSGSEWKDTGNTADLSALNAEIATLTNENVSIYSKQGKQLLKTYIKIIIKAYQMCKRCSRIL